MEDNVKKRRKTLIIAIILIVAIAIILSIQHDVDVEVEGEGTVEPTHASVHLFGTAQFKITPAEGYRLSEVLVDGESKDIKNGVLKLTNILSDHKVRVIFTPIGTYQLDISTEGNGSVSPSSGAYAKGESVVLDITPDEGYVISDVIVDGESIGSTNRLLVTMDSDHSVKVIFREQTESDPVVDVSVDVKVGMTTGAYYGTISPSGLVRIAYGGSLTVTIALNEGYVLSSVVVDGKEMGTSPIVTVTNITKDVSIDITVLSTAVKTYTITSSSTSGGSISPSGSVSVVQGDSQTFTIAAYSGYHLSSLVVDGESISYSGSTYTFTNVTSDHMISAVFVADPTPGPTPPSPKTLQSISLSGHPTTCVVGQQLDTSGIVVTAHWSDGTQSQVTGYSVSSTTFTTVGSHTVTVKYQDKTATFEVNVIQANYTVSFVASEGGSVSKSSITVLGGIVPSASDNTLSFGGTMVTATPQSEQFVFGLWVRSDGKAIETSIDSDVTFTASFLQLTSIYVKTVPTKTSYFVGDAFDSTGMSIKAVYSQGSLEKEIDVDISECTFSPSRTLVVTDTSVTITWEGKVCTHEVSVTTHFTTEVVSIGDKQYTDHQSISQLSPISIGNMTPGQSTQMVVKVISKTECDPYLLLYKLSDTYGMAQYITITVGSTTVKLSEMPTTASPDEAKKIVLGHWNDNETKEITMIIGFSGDTPSSMMGKSLSFILGIGIWQDP